VQNFGGRRLEEGGRGNAKKGTRAGAVAGRHPLVVPDQATARQSAVAWQPDNRGP
jgi:hypothetical protein